MNSSPETISSTPQADESKQPIRPAEGLGLLSKTTLGAILFATVPMLLVSMILYGWGLSLKNRSTPTVAVTEVQKYSDSLGLGVGVLGIASGAIAALLARKKVHVVLDAAHTAHILVNRLRREDVSLRSRVAGQDELVALESNLEVLYEQFPQLLANQESETERSRIVTEIGQRLRVARSAEEVFRVAVEEIRQVLRTDRVTIFRFDSAENGTIVEESVAPGCPKMLRSSLTDPCLANYLTQYRNGYVRAIDDIYNAGLDDCHIGLLERFSVKANLVAPIVKDKQVFGLLIAHQCSGSRFWPQTDIDLFLQLSIQIGFALDRTELLAQIDAKASQSHDFIEISRRIQSSLNPDDILQTTVEELRKVLVTDRVMIYSFDANWYGTVVAESVVPGFPKALWAKIKDPCFAEGYVEQYQKGRVQATDNIYDAGLTECHLKQLEPFGVKANLVAPILKDDHLFALLIAHECSKPRQWQQTEIDLMAQLATQVGFALDHARTLAQVDSRAEQAQILNDISQRFQEALHAEDIYKTAAEKVRKAIRADRAVVYLFNANGGGNGGGKVVAESVLVGWPHAMDSKNEDHCIPTSVRDMYQAGRVVCISNVAEAGLHPDHQTLMERLKIQSSLITPLLSNDNLVGLLIAHHCSGPRDWHPSEIELVTQVATQSGLALHSVSILDQVEQAYQLAEATSAHHHQKLERLQHQAGEWIKQSEPAVQTFANDVLLQMESVTALYHHLKCLATEIQDGLLSLSQQQHWQQQTHHQITQGQNALETLHQNLSDLQTNGMIAAERIQHLSTPAEQVASLSNRMTQLASQMKLQAMNAALEATRKGDSAKEFAAIGEKVLDLARQLDTQTGDLAAIAKLLQSQLVVATGALQEDVQQRKAGWQSLEQLEQTFTPILEANTQLKIWLESMTQIIEHQSETSDLANQAILEVASHANQATEHATLMSNTLTQMTALSTAEETV